jgi:hypothetical protein
MGEIRNVIKILDGIFHGGEGVSSVTRDTEQRNKTVCYRDGLQICGTGFNWLRIQSSN